MKQPTKNEITNKLNDLFLDKISRESVSEWAMEYIKNDKDIDIKDINAWHYLVAISVIDLMISPGKYLYTKEDINDWINKFSN